MRTDEGYELLTNRDEKLTRSPAHGPRLLESGGVRYLAPLDGEFGGTWVGVNEFGIAMCLLNGMGPADGLRSRGLLVRDLLDSVSVDEALRRAGGCGYAPFRLLLLGTDAKLIEWDGRRLAAGAARHLLVSSSYDQAGVERARRHEFARAPSLLCFHRSHADSPSAYSPCMHRADAATVSFTRVCVTRSRVQLSYTGAPPCRRAPGTTITLARRS
jgi:hypothetical protein